MADVEDSIANLRQALGLVTTALQILDGFNHRNKNQHRLSKWWAEFNTLRRHVGKLALEVQENLAKQERFAKYKKKSPKAGHDEDVKARAAHIRVQLLPRAYLSFSQLAADNQHAHLGLMLLGVLAQVDKVLGLLIPEGVNPALDPSDEEISTAGSHVRKDPAVPELPREDMGVAVARDDVMLETKAQKRGMEKEEVAEQETPVMEASKDKPAKKTKKKKGDEFDALFGTLEPKKVAKKKKKRPKGDEFDDLFVSLM